MGIIIRQPDAEKILPLRSKVLSDKGDGLARVAVEGTTRLIAERYVELYPVRVLAAAMLHKTQTVPVWEKLGFPKPNISIDTNEHRWYTAEQVVATNILFRRHCNGKRTPEKARTKFIDSLRRVFYDPTLKANAETDVITVKGIPYKEAA